MNFIKYALNLPWTLIAFLLAIISIPTSLHIKNRAIVIDVSSFWWHASRGVRAITLGNVIVLGRKLQKNDLEHEFIHISQHMREPLIHPILAFIELLKHGSKNSKYEQEAYGKAGNEFIDN